MFHRLGLGRKSALDRVREEGLSEEVTFKQTPEVAGDVKR